MALIGNLSVLQKSPALFTNGRSTAGAHAGTVRSNMQKRVWSLSRFQSGMADSRPAGYSAGLGITLALRPGRMASFSPASSATGSVNLAGGRNLTTSGILAIAKLDAQLDKIVSLIASGALAISKLDAVLAAAAGATASSAMAISVVDAICGAIFSVSGNAAASVAPSASLSALAHLEAEAGGPTPLSPEGLAAAVLDALLADYTLPGSVGEALGNVGASSNPWSAITDDNDTPGTFGGEFRKLLTTSKFLALK